MLLLLLALLAAGCGGSDKASPDKSVTAAATQSSVTPDVAPTAAATDDPTASVLNPLSFLSSGGAQAARGGVATNPDPDLEALLLTGSDLPSGYGNATGDAGYSVDLPQGQMKMAAATLGQEGVEIGTMVMSEAISMPASALSEFDSQLSKLDQMSPDEVQKQLGAGSASGVAFRDVSLEKNDLGDGGVTMKMVMDMSGMAKNLGSSPEQTGAFQAGIAFNGYLFKRGDRVLMLIVMWPADGNAQVDGMALAKIMDGRASAQ